MIKSPKHEVTSTQAATRAADDRAWTRGRALALLAVLVVGIGIRVWRFASPALWIDEFVSYWIIKDAGPWEIVTRCLYQRANPPLYFLLLKGSVSLFGETEWAMRLPSVVLGSLLLVGMFFFVRKLVNVDVAVLATGFLALHPLLIYESQDARMYALALVLSLCCVWSLVWIVRAERGWYAYAAYLLSAVALVFTHYLFITVIAFANVWYAVWWVRRGRREGRRAWGWLAANLLAAAALAPGVLATMGPKAFTAKPGRAAPADVLDAITNLLKVQYLLLAAVVTLGLEYVVAGLKALRWSPDARGRQALAFGTYWFCVTASLILGLAYVLSSTLLWERYAIMSVLPAGLLVAVLVGFVEPRRTRLMLAVILGATLLAPRVHTAVRTGVFALYHGQGYARGWREPLRQVDPDLRSDDLVFVQSIMVETRVGKRLLHRDSLLLQRLMSAPVSEFYLTDMPEVRALPAQWSPRIVQEHYADRFEEALRVRGRFWVACAYEPYYLKLHDWLTAEDGPCVHRVLHAQNMGCHIALYEPETRSE